MSPPDTSDPPTEPGPEQGTGEPGAVRTGTQASTGDNRRRLMGSSVPGVPWTRMLFIGVVCFAVWFLFDAPSLHRSAEVSPIGVRRTVSLAVTGPVADVSRSLGLSNVVGWADDLLGRNPGGGPQLAAVKPGHHVLRPPAQKPAVTGSPSSSTTTSTLPVLPAAPTAAAPLRVLVIGDSIGLDLGQPLVVDLSNTGVVQATLDGHIDTGLARPDYFNWPAELSIDLANDHPQLVVVMMGANDPQTMMVNGTAVAYGNPQWNDVYGQRAGAFIDAANQAGAHVLWVGMPPMQSPQLNAEVANINQIDQQQVSLRPTGATYLSSVPVLGTPQGGYTAYLTDGSGNVVNVRTPDGIHLAPGGGERLSQAVLTAIRQDLHIALPPG